MMDVVTPAYRGAYAIAQVLPGSLIDVLAPGVAGLAAWRPGDQRAMVERHQRRVDPGLGGADLQRRVREVFRSYGRYYGESFRLPTIGAEELDRGLTREGFEHVDEALARGVGPMLVLPHLGSWEWCAYWLTRVRNVPVTAVVERVEPPALFDWFIEFRERIGMEIVPLGPDAGRSIVKAIKQAHVIALLCDRDIGGGGAEVTFFGETTSLPSGPAVLALRTGAPLIPTGVYDLGGGHHHAILRPPIPAERRGSFRDDVARITQAMAHELEGLIRRAPDQWHMLQPNWPSDRTGARRVKL
jgi:phosphatidylinositol dimannoside acyltransferase